MSQNKRKFPKYRKYQGVKMNEVKFLENTMVQADNRGTKEILNLQTYRVVTRHDLAKRIQLNRESLGTRHFKPTNRRERE